MEDKVISRKQIEYNEKLGYLTTMNITIDNIVKLGSLEKKYMNTDYAVILLAIDDQWRNLRELIRISHSDISNLEYSKIHSFLGELCVKGWLVKFKEGKKDYYYRRRDALVLQKERFGNLKISKKGEVKEMF